MSVISHEKEPANTLLFPGKIGVITEPVFVNEYTCRSVNNLIKKYGPEKIAHITWSADFLTNQKKMTETINALAADREIKALIINQAVPGTCAAVADLKSTRDDIFVTFCSMHEDVKETIANAHLLLMQNVIGMGSAIVRQAKKQGAKVFVHYSFPRHMEVKVWADRREVIRETCKIEGLQYVDATSLDPTKEAGISGARQFILEDVPKLVTKYGEDTAFFSTNCAQQAPLIKSVIDCHAIYSQSCCPSPYHGFPEALGIEAEEGVSDLNQLITEACRIAAEKGMTDRLSTWPVSIPMLLTNVSVEYAIRWIRGEVAKTGVNDQVLEDCINEYVNGIVGEGVEVEMTSYSENGISYNNFKLLLMSYLDF